MNSLIKKDLFENEWVNNLSNHEGEKILARLEQLKDLSNYIDCLREGYTRTLKINGYNNDGVKIPKIKEELPTIPEKDEIDIKNI
tara:strand:+ start:223 stop:477 length:255 start_codon:yes stop_codon:yes gene_type:complete